VKMQASLTPKEVDEIVREELARRGFEVRFSQWDHTKTGEGYRVSGWRAEVEITPRAALPEGEVREAEIVEG
jgi:hypothetical protein